MEGMVTGRFDSLFLPLLKLKNQVKNQFLFDSLNFLS